VLTRAEVHADTPLICSISMQAEELVGLVSTQQNALELIIHRRLVADSLLNCLKLLESLSFTTARWEAFLAKYRSPGGASLTFEEMEHALASTPLADSSFGSKLAS
jgi:hypothetical protein